MNKIFDDIIGCFTTDDVGEVISESYSELSIKFNFIYKDVKPDNAFFEKIKSNLHSRDTINISILNQDEVIENYDTLTSNNGNFLEYIDDCYSQILEGAEITIIITISKNLSGSILTIYYIDLFIEYLEKLNVNVFLEIFENLFSNEHIIFDVQDSSFDRFNTETIYFMSKVDDINRRDINRSKRINQIKNICHSNILASYSFLPEDFYPINHSEKYINLNNIFNKLSLLYSTIFLFDIVNLNTNNTIDYKLNGYKSINKIIDTSNLNNGSYEIYYNIYSWVYEGGNIIDKIGLTRNIVSLNFDPDNLEITDSAFTALISSFRIYQKENIKQYVDIRNKISDQLLELQNKAEKIVENFINDFKKSIFTLISLFISIVVIRVVSKGDFIGGFTFETTLLTIGFLIIAFFIFLFSKWELNKQVERYVAYYKNLKLRYSDLLDSTDINRILNNDNDFNLNIVYIKNRKSRYTLMWIASLILLFAIVIILYIRTEMIYFGLRIDFLVAIFHNLAF